MRFKRHLNQNNGVRGVQSRSGGTAVMRICADDTAFAVSNSKTHGLSGKSAKAVCIESGSQSLPISLCAMFPASDMQ